MPDVIGITADNSPPSTGRVLARSTDDHIVSNTRSQNHVVAPNFRFGLLKW